MTGSIGFTLYIYDIYILFIHKRKKNLEICIFCRALTLFNEAPLFITGQFSPFILKEKNNAARRSVTKYIFRANMSI